MSGVFTQPSRVMNTRSPRTDRRWLLDGVDSFARLAHAPATRAPNPIVNDRRFIEGTRQRGVAVAPVAKSFAKSSFNVSRPATMVRPQ